MENFAITLEDQIGIALDPIRGLVSDDTVTDIFVYGKEKIFAKKFGEKLKRIKTSWKEDIDLMVACSTIAQKMKRKLNSDHPILDARLHDGSRVNIVINPLYSDGACISIRKFPKKKMTENDLINKGTLDQNGVEILKALVMQGTKIIISGGTGTGKTTLLNILCNYINKGDIVVTIEDARELQIDHEFWAPLESKKAFYEGEKEITLRDLVINSFRMLPRWIILGEVRSGEVFDLMRAFGSGHSGMSSLHANSTRDALIALENMFLQGKEMRIDAVRQVISRAVDVVVQLERFDDEKIRVTEISEVAGIKYNEGISEYILKSIYEFQLQTIDDEGNIKGNHKVVGIPQYVEKIRGISGATIPEIWK